MTRIGNMSGQPSDFLQAEAEEAEVWLLILPPLENRIYAASSYERERVDVWRTQRVVHSLTLVATRCLNSRADW